MLIKVLSWPMTMHEININNITCSYTNYTNHDNLPKRVVYTGHISWLTKYQHMIYLCLLAYDQLVRMTMGPNGDYFVWQVKCPHLHIISQSQDFQQWSCSVYKFRKTWLTSFHSHINLAWICNIRLDYSKTFWRLRLTTCRFNCFTSAITGRFAIVYFKKHTFSTNTKIMLMETQIHKVLVVLVLSSTTIREVN